MSHEPMRAHSVGAPGVAPQPPAAPPLAAGSGPQVVPAAAAPAPWRDPAAQQGVQGQQLPPPSPGSGPGPRRGMSIASLVIGGVGVISAGVAGILGIGGLILGIIALRREPAGRILATLGIVLSALSLLMMVGQVIVTIVLLQQSEGIFWLFVWLFQALFSG